MLVIIAFCVLVLINEKEIFKLCIQNLRMHIYMFTQDGMWFIIILFWQVWNTNKIENKNKKDFFI